MRKDGGEMLLLQGPEQPAGNWAWMQGQQGRGFVGRLQLSGERWVGSDTWWLSCHEPQLGDLLGGTFPPRDPPLTAIT